MKSAFSSRLVICVCIAVVGSTTAFGDFVSGDLSNAAPVVSGGAVVDGTLATFNEEESGSSDFMTLKQEVQLDPGDYILSYDLYFFSGDPSDSDYFNVTLGGGDPLLSMNNNEGEDYTSYGLTKIIDSAHPNWITWSGTVEHSLEISSHFEGDLLLSLEVDHSDQGGHFTKVSISDVKIVPLPGSLLLGGLGLVVANWRLKRRKTA